MSPMATSVIAKFRCLLNQREISLLPYRQSGLSSVSPAQAFRGAPPHGKAGGYTAGAVGNLCLAGGALEAGWQSLRDLMWHQVLTFRQPDSALKIS